MKQTKYREISYIEPITVLSVNFNSAYAQEFEDDDIVVTCTGSVCDSDGTGECTEYDCTLTINPMITTMNEDSAVEIGNIHFMVYVYWKPETARRVFDMKDIYNVIEKIFPSLKIIIDQNCIWGGNPIFDIPFEDVDVAIADCEFCGIGDTREE